MNRPTGALLAALTCLLVALVAAGCSRSDLEYAPTSGDDGGNVADGPVVQESGPPPSCGDGRCESNESCSTCALDCGACPSCGNGTCDGTDTCSNCPQDCGKCATCGDGKCTMPQENCQNCAPDCGACPGCGDGVCTPPNETCFSCPKDCGNCPGCGDGICQSNETCASCPEDCGSCDVCGNGKCEKPLETCVNCPADCGQCMVIDCAQSFECAIGCLGGLGGGGGGGFGFGDGGLPLTCLADCIAQGCPNAQQDLQDVIACLTSGSTIAQCGGFNIGCLMNVCSGQITACFSTKC